jgi:hypothetical protein
MRIAFKTLLLCLLLTLLPLQGFANALAPSCARAMHTDQAEMMMHHTTSHCHDGAMAQHQHTTHGDCCNGCGACCNGIAALPVILDFTAPADLLHLHTLPSDRPFSGFTPAVPKRPPRLLII